MKTPTMEEIIEEIKVIRNSIKNDWSKWGDCSYSEREWVIRKLYRIETKLKKPIRVDLK